MYIASCLSLVLVRFYIRLTHEYKTPIQTQYSKFKKSIIRIIAHCLVIKPFFTLFKLNNDLYLVFGLPLYTNFAAEIIIFQPTVLREN